MAGVGSFTDRKRGYSEEGTGSMAADSAGSHFAEALSDEASLDNSIKEEAPSDEIRPVWTDAPASRHWLTSPTKPMHGWFADRTNVWARISSGWKISWVK